jgi:hypothetical protein
VFVKIGPRVGLGYRRNQTAVRIIRCLIIGSWGTYALPRIGSNGPRGALRQRRFFETCTREKSSSFSMFEQPILTYTEITCFRFGLELMLA